MSRRQRRTVLVVGILMCALVLGGWPSTAEEETPAPGRRLLHSSDGVVGAIALPLPAFARHAGIRSNEREYRVAPGLRYFQWDETDARGRIRAYLLRANLNRPGLALQYAAPAQVSSRERLTRILRHDGAVAGVNGDFFDIADTGAPLGVGVDESTVVHGPRQGWTMSFLLNGLTSDIGAAPVVAEIEGRPGIRITNLNSPTVYGPGIGVYTPRWGEAPGYAVTDGALRRNLRQVVVRRGVVVSNTRALSVGTRIRGPMLIGRGDGADTLRTRLPVGTRVRLRTRAAGDPSVAVSGNQRLLEDGLVVAFDDSEMHPRTAVGIDQDTGRIFLLVIDGRQQHSRGFTMLELAELMLSLGAEDALNLDGGGSSAMVTRRPSGRVRVANSPSDGEQRPIPNGLQLVYSAP